MKDVPLVTTPCDFDVSNFDFSRIKVNPDHGYVYDQISRENAEKLIIQIDVIHGHPKLSSVEEKFAPLQNDALMMFKSLSDQFDLSGIYCDGLTEKNAKDLAKYFKAYREIENSHDDLGLTTNQIRELHQSISSLIRQLKIFELAKSEQFSFRITENDQLIAAALKVDPRSPERAVLNNRREDFILERMLGSGDTVSIVFMGAAHNLKDNIEKLNSNGAGIAYLRLRPKELPRTSDIHELKKFAEELAQ